MVQIFTLGEKGDIQFFRALTDKSKSPRQSQRQLDPSCVQSLPCDYGQRVDVLYSELGIAESKVDLVERADEMLYRAKARGRNQVATTEDKVATTNA